MSSLTITDEDLGISSEDNGILETRNAVRLILENSEKKIALVYSDKHGHHKLPGGGVEEGEENETAAIREAKEEAGCEATLKQKFEFSIIELRKQFKQKQISTLFLATVKGEMGNQELTESEITDGFSKPIWVSLDEAIELFEQDKPKTYVGKFMHARDLSFLKAIKSFDKSLQQK